ncbi:MAG: GntR family transcriptional regulator [Chitinivibrionales bacterium]|nr:GntR family transcriptional regulator [Chitinivibrionales bacterium]MBD3396399.1 GntR family transcriptional regulator [Chitinivibrionales bacterium]
MPFLHETIARRLRAEIQRGSEARLPSLKKLSADYGVSLGTMLKAVHLLCKEGLLQSSRGKRTIVRGREHRDATDTTAGNAAAGLRDSIRDKITSGIYKTGRSLPKVATFVLAHGVSKNTACAALKLLEGEKLIHKHGKKWIVGPAEGISRRTGAAQWRRATGPVVLVLLREYRDWRRSLFSQYMAPLASGLFQELNRHGIEVKTVLAGEPHISSRFYASGRKDILSLINSLGNRYLGTVIVSYVNDFLDLDLWVKWLSGFQKPVVWIDHDGTSLPFEWSRVSRAGCYHCYADEDAMVGAALQSLSDAGHRRIGFHVPASLVDHVWLNRRVDTIGRLARDLFPAMTITYEHQDAREKWLSWDMNNDSGIFDFVSTIAETIDRGHPRAGAHQREALARTELRRAVPSIHRLLSKGRITALLAPNQALATSYYYLFRFLGMSIPGDMSIVAFDDIPDFRRHPISTVDQGFDELAYGIAHVFIGDIPVRADRRGNKPAEPRFVHRGSVGPPKKDTR